MSVSEEPVGIVEHQDVVSVSPVHDSDEMEDESGEFVDDADAETVWGEQ